MAIPNTEISLIPFRKALSSLSQILKEPKSPITRDATLLRFEYTFELSWKLLKRYLESNNNVVEFNLKNLFREAGKQGLINVVEEWFDFLKARNLTSHTYDELTAEKVYQIAIIFEKEAQSLLAKMEKILA